MKLPEGLVAHPDSSTHGFTVNPASPISKEPFPTNDARRFINVFPFYDVEDHGESTAATLEYYSSLNYRSDEKDVTRLSRRAFALAGLPGLRIEDQLSDSVGNVRRDSILAFRRQDGILYELMLESPAKSYAADEVLFNRIVEGFRLSKLPNDGCSNQ